MGDYETFCANNARRFAEERELEEEQQRLKRRSAPTRLVYKTSTSSPRRRGMDAATKAYIDGHVEQLYEALAELADEAGSAVGRLERELRTEFVHKADSVVPIRKARDVA